MPITHYPAGPFTDQPDMAVSVLDHGFVKLRNLAGPTRRTDNWFDADDTDPANTARLSFDNLDAGRTREADLKLCDYLMKNKHSTPLEMIEVWLEMKMPIFVARQFVRHRTVTINEVSARYVQLPEEWYIPDHYNVGLASKNKKQGRDNPEWDDMSDDEQNLVQNFRMALNDTCSKSYSYYDFYIKQGIAPELARSFLHMNHYTHWVWKQNLWNMMHFLSLRDHSHAQFEAREYAKAVRHLLGQHLPELMKLYDKHRRLE